ncbi:hypothetical protein J7T55_006954 [Diaporthe amygdali]|uniref:uncharacterized protein n=1 Tax=Phomopsis amygdali TaxID=1214568 RepID=UPI0022FE1DB5|nr:uncharacterized protein J7T55_006954 [Diaporthe amygdali]KAJ0107075.1 hypothetical protein J7T55_006954 [Diaporthe amygdali]
MPLAERIASVLDESASSSSSSSASSPPHPPLPDAVLHSLRLSSQRQVDDTHLRVTEAPPGIAEKASHRPCSADSESPDATRDNVIYARSSGQMDWSGLSDDRLDRIIANLEARALERREKIRKIEALSKELGLDVCQENWVASLNHLASSSSPSIGNSQPNGDGDEVRDGAHTPHVIEPVSTPGASITHNPIVLEEERADSYPHRQGEHSGTRHLPRLLRGLKRSYSQSERQNADPADSREDENVGGVTNRSPSPAQADSSRSQAYLNNLARQRGCSTATGNNLADHTSTAPSRSPRRVFAPQSSSPTTCSQPEGHTAWSIILQKYPEEIAQSYRPGERPTNLRIVSMKSLARGEKVQSRGISRT